jgi:ATP diphosphatase
MSESQRYDLDDLIELMRRLRDPRDGCPWDLKQSYRSITPSTIEEVYEVVDAIEREDHPHLKEELGDLLFQVVFYAQLAAEEGHFDLHQVVDELTAKLLRRHPHVFPDGTLASRRPPHSAPRPEALSASWEAIKAAERAAKGRPAAFDDVPAALPALLRAVKLQKRAAKLGFDWPRWQPVLSKLDEELAELKQALSESASTGPVDDRVVDDSVAEELGDVMFTCVNLARHLSLDPETLVRQANLKFEQRFRKVEAQMGENPDRDFSPEQLEGFWQRAKDCGQGADD